MGVNPREFFLPQPSGFFLKLERIIFCVQFWICSCLLLPLIPHIPLFMTLDSLVSKIWKDFFPTTHSSHSHPTPPTHRRCRPPIIGRLRCPRRDWTVEEWNRWFPCWRQTGTEGIRLGRRLEAILLTAQAIEWSLKRGKILGSTSFPSIKRPFLLHTDSGLNVVTFWKDFFLQCATDCITWIKFGVFFLFFFSPCFMTIQPTPTFFWHTIKHTSTCINCICFKTVPSSILSGNWRAPHTKGFSIRAKKPWISRKILNAFIFPFLIRGEWAL